MSLKRSAEHGFTLIELLVSLLIFAMMATAGVLLLSGSVSAQGAIRGRLDDMAAVRRAAAAMTADFAQAAPRISRTEGGTLAPAFFAAPRSETGRPLVQFVRSGWDVPDGRPQSRLQKVEYRLNGDRLERVAFRQVDGAAAGEPLTLVEGVAAAALRFRDDRGAWRDDWTSAKPLEMPRLVELLLTRRGQPPLRLLFPVAPGPEQRPAGIQIDG